MPRKYSHATARRFPASTLITYLIKGRYNNDGKPATPFDAAMMLDVSSATIYGWLGKDFKFTVWQADRYACRIGEHPCTIWPDLYWDLEADRVVA